MANNLKADLADVGQNISKLVAQTGPALQRGIAYVKAAPAKIKTKMDPNSSEENRRRFESYANALRKKEK